jgi:hypothetical protein
MKYVVYNCRNTVFENEKLCFYCGLITGFWQNEWWDARCKRLRISVAWNPLKYLWACRRGVHF